MATIVFLDDVAEFTGSRLGCTFDKSQAGPYVKKRPSPINHNTTPRQKLRTLLKDTNAYYWAMTSAQRTAWATWAANNGITGPWGQTKHQAGCAGFFAVELNARLAGDSFYITPPGNLPLAGVTFTNLTRIDKDTIRATFTPSPAGANNRIFLKQTLPGPGIRRWAKIDSYVADYSGLNPTSPHDFSTHFQHLTGWNCRYWTGTQEASGRRSNLDLWEL